MLTCHEKKFWLVCTSKPSQPASHSQMSHLTHSLTRELPSSPSYKASLSLPNTTLFGDGACDCISHFLEWTFPYDHHHHHHHEPPQLFDFQPTPPPRTRHTMSQPRHYIHDFALHNYGPRQVSQSSKVFQRSQSQSQEQAYPG